MTIRTTFMLGGLLLVTFLVLSLYASFPVRNASASPVTANAISAATTSTAIAVTTSTRLLATTTSVGGTSYTRIYASICNPSANLVYLNMNQDKPASITRAVTVIGAAAGYSACYEITDKNQYSGSVQASSTNETSTSVLVTEYTQ